jgi:ABC-type oligopeptide transport system ATPase subunit
MNPIYTKWNEIGNIAIVGSTGSGKTNTACFLAAQVALARGRLIICDPHGRAAEESRDQTLLWNVEPLAPAFLCEPAIDDDAIGDAIRLANDMYLARKEGKSAASFPVWLIVDEFADFMRNSRHADDMALLLENITTQGRKFLVGAMLCSSQWHTTRSGGGELRSAINVAIIHQIKRDIANMVVKLGKYLPDTWRLSRGEALLCRNDIIRIGIPEVKRADLLRVAARLGDQQLAVYAPNKQVINTVSSEQDAEIAAPAQSADQRRVIELFEAGEDTPAIARKVFHTTSGPPYQRALARVNAILRENYVRRGYAATQT